MWCNKRNLGRSREANEGDISTIPLNGDLMVQQMTFLKMTGVENGPLVEEEGPILEHG